MSRGTILVTGGAGYIGSHVVLQLRERGESVVVTGEPLELLMFSSGRDEARVEFTGAEAAIAAVKAGRSGL